MTEAVHYTYQVAWSPEDGQYVATVVEFPSLSWLADSPVDALAGLGSAIIDPHEDEDNYYYTDAEIDEGGPIPEAGRAGGVGAAHRPPAGHRHERAHHQAYWEFFSDYGGEWYSLERYIPQDEPQEVIREAPEITDPCVDCNDEADAPDCTICGASNAGSREHPHLCESCQP